MPVYVEEAERVRPGGGVAAGQRHDQLRGLARGGELAQLAADRLDLRGPVQAQHPAQRSGRDPGGALGPRLPGQRQEHQRQQRRGQPVEPVLEPAVDLAGRIQQAGALQGGQRQQQPGQRIPRARGEHRDGALAQQTPPGQRPFPLPGHRVRQHRNQRVRVRVTIPAVPDRALCSGDAVCRGRPAGRYPAQRVARAERRHPGRRGDLPQGRPRRIQPGDPPRQLRGQLRGPLRAPPRGDQPGHPARGQRLIPPPDGGRVHPERLRHLTLRGGPQPDQLHRRQPPARLIARIPREGSQPVHDHQAAVLAGQQAHARGDLRRPGGQQRERQLAEHTSHHPPIPPGRLSCHNFLTKGRAETPRHPGKHGKCRNKSRSGRDRTPVTPRKKAAMSGALRPGTAASRSDANRAGATPPPGLAYMAMVPLRVNTARGLPGIPSVISLRLSPRIALAGLANLCARHVRPAVKISWPHGAEERPSCSRELLRRLWSHGQSMPR